MNSHCTSVFNPKNLYVKFMDGDSAQYESLYNFTGNKNIKNSNKLYIFDADPNKYIVTDYQNYNIFLGADKRSGHFLAKEVGK